MVVARDCSLCICAEDGGQGVYGSDTGTVFWGSEVCWCRAVLDFSLPYFDNRYARTAVCGVVGIVYRWRGNIDTCLPGDGLFS